MAMLRRYCSPLYVTRTLCQPFSNPIAPCLCGLSTTQLTAPTHHHCGGTESGFRSSVSACRQPKRCMSTKSPRTMKAWQTMAYGGPELLQLADVAVPVVKNPNDVLVKVSASSVNPIDVRCLGGYGSSTLNKIRYFQTKGDFSEFPLVLGRDFAGEVVSVGKGISSSQLRVGDKVWGVSSPYSLLGSHAEYTLTQASMVSRMPSSVSYTEAASIPYGAMTMWSAVCVAGGMSARNASGKRVLILGAGGGIGTLAVQLLKAWDAEVTAVASKAAEDLLLSLGADIIIDYKQPGYKEDMMKVQGFDLILNLVPGEIYEWTTKLLRQGCGAKFVTINSPILRNNDQMGVPLGIAKSLFDLSSKAVPSLASGVFYRWAVWAPSRTALKTMGDFIEQGKMRPIVGNTFSFDEVPAAYEQVNSGQKLGKVAIDYEASSSQSV